jgi:Fungal protein of unknown function (DUF1752)
MAQVESRTHFLHTPQNENYYFPTTTTASRSSSASPPARITSPTLDLRISPGGTIPKLSQDDIRKYYNDCLVRSRSLENVSSLEIPGILPIYENATTPDSTATQTASERSSASSVATSTEVSDEDDVREMLDPLKAVRPPDTFPPVADDIWTERGPAPSLQVDYLSHDWAEPDIWCSWRYVRKEKAEYPQNAARLENASWRTWAKSKYNLPTITPEKLNWY